MTGAWLRLGHLNIHVGDTLQHSEENVKSWIALFSAIIIIIIIIIVVVVVIILLL